MTNYCLDTMHIPFESRNVIANCIHEFYELISRFFTRQIRGLLVAFKPSRENFVEVPEGFETCCNGSGQRTNEASGLPLLRCGDTIACPDRCGNRTNRTQGIAP